MQGRSQCELGQLARFFYSTVIARDFAPDLPLVNSTASEIEQVVLNLLRNASQAMAENGNGEKPPRIVLRLRAEKRMVCLQVEDKGPGMEAEIRKRVFKPFFLPASAPTPTPSSGPNEICGFR